MIDIRLHIARALLLAFPLIGGAGVVAALPRAIAQNPVLIIPIVPNLDIAAMTRAHGGYLIGASDPPIGKLVHSQSADFLPSLRTESGLLLLDATKLPDFMCGTNA